MAFRAIVPGCLPVIVLLCPVRRRYGLFPLPDERSGRGHRVTVDCAGCRRADTGNDPGTVFASDSRVNGRTRCLTEKDRLLLSSIGAMRSLSALWGEGLCAKKQHVISFHFSY